jgi:hypothetical protein
MRKKVTPPEAAMADHITDLDGRCILCGQLIAGPAAGSPCPGVPAEEEVTRDFKEVGDSFLPASQDEYDPNAEDIDEYFNSFTHDPDKPSFNVICPVCGGRPCFPSCKLGPWTSEEIAAINNSMPPLLPGDCT